MPSVTGFCDFNHSSGEPTLVPQLFGGRVDLILRNGGSRKSRIARPSDSKTTCRFYLSFYLLGKAICLGNRAHRERVVEIESSSVERLTVEFEQRRILNFLFQYLHGGRG